MSEQPIKLTAIVVVKDEEQQIARCLASVRDVADEILVIHDGPCHDKTLDIAKSFGAQTSVGPFWSYMEPHLVTAYNQARGEWLLRLDADEFLSQEMRQVLPRLMEDISVDAYRFNWPFFDGQKYLTHNWPEKTCLFRKKAISFVALPDAPTIVHGKTKRVPYTLLHQPAQDNFAFSTFASRWMRFAHYRADYYLGDFNIIPQFNSSLNNWPLTFRWRRRAPLLVLPFDCVTGFYRTMRDAWRHGFTGLRAGLMVMGMRAAIDWLMFTKKISSSVYPNCPCGCRRYKRYTYVTSGKEFVVLLCLNCGLGRTWPEPIENGQTPEFYKDHTGHRPKFSNPALYKGFARRPLKSLLQYKKRGALLDVGCSTGIFVKEALKAGFDGQGIDLSHIAVRDGQTDKQLLNRLSVGTLKSKKFADNSFDVLSYLHCLEHISDIDGELTEARRVLREDGILVLEAPNFFSVWRRVLGNRWYGFSPFEHIWQLTDRGLLNALERTGWSPIKVIKRHSMFHKITASPSGAFKLVLRIAAWLTASGDDLLIVARKKI